MNAQLNALPQHLQQYIVPQHYEKYSPVNHAVWRYVMRLNTDYLPKVAHESYLNGLKTTGITLEKIPAMTEMNEKLNKIGWAACTVDGFINPQAFMEFQAYKVLVIAAEIRQLKHIEYTPAPDIIHEAAGHAPIIADANYAEYLRYFGEIGSKAFSSKEDNDLFEAIRYLSIIKENPDTPQQEITKGEQAIKTISANMGTPSEMALIRRLHWWTVEYGLIGTVENPKIYGAGLLSSIGESYWCMQPKVKKIPYSIEAANYDFDITKPQPQLFVTPTFEHLTKVLNQFAESMALRRGGTYGLETAIASKNTATLVYSSGLQVTGKITDFKKDKNGNPAYIQLSGPTALAYNNRQLESHSKKYHAEGYGSPVGKLMNSNQLLETMSDSDLKQLGIEQGETVRLQFESGVVVEGKLQEKTRNSAGKLMLLPFHNCRVTYKNQTLFEPAWGVYDMAVGQHITSVFPGAAAPGSYGFRQAIPATATRKTTYTPAQKQLHRLYQQVRDIREKRDSSFSLSALFQEVKKYYPDEWLLPLEIYEVVLKNAENKDFSEELKHYLQQQAANYPQYAKLINDGLRLLE